MHLISHFAHQSGLFSEAISFLHSFFHMTVTVEHFFLFFRQNQTLRAELEMSKCHRSVALVYRNASLKRPIKFGFKHSRIRFSFVVAVDVHFKRWHRMLKFCFLFFSKEIKRLRSSICESHAYGIFLARIIIKLNIFGHIFETKTNGRKAHRIRIYRNPSEEINKHWQPFAMIRTIYTCNTHV